MTEEMVMTVVTPMTMPRMVRPERSLLVRSVSSAILTDSRVCPCAMSLLRNSYQFVVLSQIILRQFDHCSEELSDELN